MATDKVVETVMVGNYVEMETEGKPKDMKARFSKFLWHGGSAYDAWFSCASNQVNFLYSLQSFFHSYRKLMLFLTSLLVFSFFFPGGSSIAYIALLIFSTRDAIRHLLSALLWVAG
jgi:auxin influx carrier (AUX1 LAX family)